MRMCLSLLILFVVNTAVSSDSPSDCDNAAVVADPLDGSWHLINSEICGRNEPRIPHDLVVTYHGGKFTAVRSDFSVTGTYKTDARRSPAHLDERDIDGRDKGKEWKEIYQIEGDILRVAYKRDTERPKDFDTDHNSGLHIDTYKRLRR
jgi:uncharacterized protein (TIGR03067 family)